MIPIILGIALFVAMTYCIMFGPCGQKRYWKREGWGGNGSPTRETFYHGHEEVTAPNAEADGGYTGGFDQRQHTHL